MVYFVSKLVIKCLMMSIVLIKIVIVAKYMV